MFLDDDYPDYFLDDGSEPGSAAPQERKEPATAPRRPESERSDRPDRPMRAGETISFADDIPPRRSDIPASTARHDGDNRLLTGRGRRSLGCGCLVVLAIAAVIAYFRYLSPCVDDAVMEVCVTHIEKRGVFFKTYEAEIVVPETSATRRDDTPYTRPSAVTVSDPAVAERLSALQATGRPVRLRYRRYYGTLPWRGESKTVVTGFAD